MRNSDAAPGEGVDIPATQRVEAYLRNAIVTGKLRPRQRIIQETTAEMLGVSRGAVREALLRLERDGLVLMVPGEGTFVRGVASSEIDIVFRMRAKLEGLSVRYMRENRSVTPERLLKGLLNKMAAAAARNNVDQFVQADMDLHRAIWNAAGQPTLYRTLSSLVDPYIFVITRFYSSRIPLSDRHDDHVYYVRLVLETSVGRIESEVEKYFEKLYHNVFEASPWFHSVGHGDWTFEDLGQWF